MSILYFNLFCKNIVSKVILLLFFILKEIGFLISYAVLTSHSMFRRQKRNIKDATSTLVTVNRFPLLVLNNLPPIQFIKPINRYSEIHLPLLRVLIALIMSTKGV